MMQTGNYRKRASEVRRSARAHLLMLQQERRNRRAEMAGGAVRQADPGEQIRVAELSADQSQPETLQKPDAGTHEASGSTDEMDQLDELAIRNAAMPEASEAASHPSATAHGEHDLVRTDEPRLLAGDPSEAVEINHPSVKKSWQESELAELPGAGPGLVWMLSQCKIYSFDDLSKQTETELSNRLGVVGQIINVGPWIDFARSKMELPK